MKTTGVKLLVHEVLNDLPRPYSVDVVDDVFQAIETNPARLKKYKMLCDELGTAVVNTWCGQWTAHALGKRGEQQVPSRKSTLIGSYSLLDTDAKPVLRKPKEDDAINMMADYYKEHRASLPADIGKYRNAIIELIMDGTSTEEAFRAFQYPPGGSAA